LTVVVAAPALSGSTAEAKKAALPAKIMAPRTAVAYLITMENPLLW
jgi:hypothetical protein